MTYCTLQWRNVWIYKSEKQNKTSSPVCSLASLVLLSLVWAVMFNPVSHWEKCRNSLYVCTSLYNNTDSDNNRIPMAIFPLMMLTEKKKTKNIFFSCAYIETITKDMLGQKKHLSVTEKLCSEKHQRPNFQPKFIWNIQKYFCHFSP